MKCKKCGQEPEVQLVCEFCGHRWVVDGLDEVIDKIPSLDSLTESKTKLTCGWKGNYNLSLCLYRFMTDCGCIFLDSHGQAREDFNYCPYCGKEILFHTLD